MSRDDLPARMADDTEVSRMANRRKQKVEIELG
jgi:hypothetical protein